MGVTYEISIHAPRKAERRSCHTQKNKKWNFNPRSAQGGATAGASAIGAGVIFQSTLRARRSDIEFDGRHGKTTDFNPRSAQGGATSINPGSKAGLSFQSTLRARRSDLKNPIAKPIQNIFQSTLRARRSDGAPALAAIQCHGISIHAPRKAERLRNTVRNRL